MTTSTKRVVMAGGALGFNWLPVYVAEREGIFARNGLTVELKRMGAVDKATAAVKSGEADVAISPPEGAITDFLAGGDLRLIAGNVNRLPLSLVANPKFERIEDLKGATLGTSSLTEGTALYTMEMLSKHGLHYPGDYQFAVVGVHPARWQALQEGTIDAAVQLIPLNFVAFDQGWSNLGEVSDYIPEIVFTALMARTSWLEANRETAIALLRSIAAATEWMYDPAREATLVPILMKIAQADEKYARIALDYMRTKQAFARALEIPPAAIAKTLELMTKAKLLDQSAASRARGVIDDSIRTEALRTGR